MHEPAQPQPPSLVDDNTALQPCRPGAWGSDTSCATHEGQPLDEGGLCFWGRPPSALERMLSESLLRQEPPSTKRRLGFEKGEDPAGVCCVSMLARAKMPALLRLARSLNVRPPLRRPGKSEDDARRELFKLISEAAARDRRGGNPIVEDDGRRLKTVG